MLVIRQCTRLISCATMVSIRNFALKELELQTSSLSSYSSSKSITPKHQPTASAISLFFYASNLPSSASICSTGSASSSECSGSLRAPELVITGLFSSLNFPSQPLLSRGGWWSVWLCAASPGSSTCGVDSEVMVAVSQACSRISCVVVEEGYHRRASHAQNMFRFQSGRWPRDTWGLGNAARVVVVIRGEGPLAVFGTACRVKLQQNCAKFEFYANGISITRQLDIYALKSLNFTALRLHSLLL